MYYKQLDSLRALAVMMVIIFHWTGLSRNYTLPLGSWGVELFFVLSGFLITKILLESRLSEAAKGRNKLFVLKNFIARRSLRIFPIYYLALIIILIFDRTNISHLQNSLGWYAGYASNFLIFKSQQWNYPMSHFWTLAVEEQFYLVWPWLVLFAPWKHLKAYFLFFILMGIATRLLLPNVFSATNVVPADVLTPTCTDCFSIGAMFSIYLTDKKNDIIKVTAIINKVGISCFIVSIVFLITKFSLFSFLHRTLDALFFLCLIANAVKGFTGFVARIANNKIVIYLGKISYGLYIYHLLTPWLTMILFNILGALKINVISNSIYFYYHLAILPRFTVDLLILVGVASASWYLIEKPFNGLKRYFTDKRLLTVPLNTGIEAGFNNYFPTKS